MLASALLPVYRSLRPPRRRGSALGACRLPTNCDASPDGGFRDARRSSALTGPIPLRWRCVVSRGIPRASLAVSVVVEFKRLRLKLAALLEQNLNAGLGLFEARATSLAQLDPLLKQRQGFL